MNKKVLVVGDDGRVLTGAKEPETLTSLGVERQIIMPPGLKRTAEKVVTAISQPIVQGPPSRQQKRRRRFIQALGKVRAMRLPRRERRAMARKMAKGGSR